MVTLTLPYINFDCLGTDMYRIFNCFGADSYSVAAVKLGSFQSTHAPVAATLSLDLRSQGVLLADTAASNS